MALDEWPIGTVTPPHVVLAPYQQNRVVLQFALISERLNKSQSVTTTGGYRANYQPVVVALFSFEVTIWKEHIHAIHAGSGTTNMNIQVSVDCTHPHWSTTLKMVTATPDGLRPSKLTGVASIDQGVSVYEDIQAGRYGTI